MEISQHVSLKVNSPPPVLSRNLQFSKAPRNLYLFFYFWLVSPKALIILFV